MQETLIVIVSFVIIALLTVLIHVALSHKGKIEELADALTECQGKLSKIHMTKVDPQDWPTFRYHVSMAIPGINKLIAERQLTVEETKVQLYKAWQLRNDEIGAILNKSIATVKKHHVTGNKKLKIEEILMHQTQ